MTILILLTALLVATATQLTQSVPSLSELLTSEGCVAECILGIEPGRTTREQVAARFGVANVSTLDDDRLAFNGHTYDARIVDDERSILLTLAGDVVVAVQARLNPVPVRALLGDFGAPGQIGQDEALVLAYPQWGLLFDIAPDGQDVVGVRLQDADQPIALGDIILRPLDACEAPDVICALATATRSASLLAQPLVQTNMPAIEFASLTPSVVGQAETDETPADDPAEDENDGTAQDASEASATSTAPTDEPLPLLDSEPTEVSGIFASVQSATRRSYEQGTLVAGRRIYVDRDYVFRTIPDALVGLPYLRLRNNEKVRRDNAYLTIELTTPATIYIAYDTRLTRPDWLRDWVDTGLTIEVSDVSDSTTTRRVLRKDFNQGTVVLGGNWGTEASTTYSVIAQPLTGIVNFIEPASYVQYGRDTMGEEVRTYIDREFVFINVPQELVGGEVIQPRSDDKFSTGEAFLTFRIAEAAAVYVAYDPRLPLPDWLADWANVNLTMGVMDTDGNVTNRRLYRKEYTAGSVTLGGNFGSDLTAMYSVIVVSTPSDIAQLRVASGRRYERGRLSLGAPIYVDRDYVFREYPPELEGAEYLVTRNEDKSFEADDVFLSFTLMRPATVFVTYDSRLEPPEWLFERAGWTQLEAEIVVTDAANGTRRTLFFRRFEAGPVVLNGNGGSVTSNMYSVIVVPDEAPGGE